MRWFFGVALGAVVCSAGGCGDAAGGLPPEPELYPVTGKVTVGGEPLPEAVVTFLQVDQKGTLAVAETDENGTYVLRHANLPGAAAADYKVAVSYLVGTDGTVYGLGPRSGLSKPYGMFSAKELIVPEWSDLSRTTARATVPEGGGVFDFELPELLPPPEPSEDDLPAETEEPEAEPAEDPAADEPTDAVDEPTADEPADEDQAG